MSAVADPDLQIRVGGGGGWGSVIMRRPYSAGVRSGGSRPSDKGGGGVGVCNNEASVLRGSQWG